ncbi:MAG: hypothetical protein SFU86_00355 [Pirellulaceae bacterium]|nr:hypothetical protein [Pirellulaceae bacterium]
MPGSSDNPSARGALPLPREMETIHSNGSASLAELREFLGGLKGKSPQEVIGIVSSSLLVQSMILATIGTALLLAVFTVGPYLVYGPPKANSTAAKPAPAATPAAETPPSATAAPPAATTNSGEPDPAKAAKAMGLDETKPADPTKNPLDDPRLDNLLDGAK